MKINPTEALGILCNTDSAIIALCEVRTLQSVAENALAAWPEWENPEAQKQCRADVQALRRVAELLEMHARAQGKIDQLLAERLAAQHNGTDDPVT